MLLFVAISIEEISHDPAKEELVMPKMPVLYSKPVNDNDQGNKWHAEIAC